MVPNQYSQEDMLITPIEGDTLTIDVDVEIYYCDSYIKGQLYLDDEPFTGDLKWISFFYFE